MRKAKLLAFSAMAGLMSLVTVNAKEMTLTELGNEALKYAPNARFIFVVGKYAYTSTYDQFNTQDIMLASADSIDLNKNGNISGQVGNMTIYRIDRTYDKSNKPNGWKAGKNEIGKGTELKDNKVDIKYIDYHSLSSLDIDAHVLSAIEKLNETGEDEDGFSSITYKDKTATFNISDPSKKLADYKNAALDAIKAFVSANNAVSVTYNKKETKLTEGTLDDVVTKLAAEVLRDMAGAKDSSIETSSLNYASVANKSAQATVKYVDEDGNTVNVTYTLKFVYDFKKEKNEVLTDVAKKLDKTIKKEESKKYGFKSVTYSNEKLTFDISDLTAKLATFADSGIVELFKKNYIGATKVELKMDNRTKTIEIDNQDLDDATIKKYAAQVLLFMNDQNGEDLEAENAKNLTLENVAGKSVTAEVTYADGKTKVTYTLEFKYDADEVKDEDLNNYVDVLNKADSNSGIHKMGFESVKYDPETNTVTFEIGQPDGKFASDTNAVKEIAEMFEKWSIGASKVVYKVNGETGEGTTVTFGEDEDSTTTLAVKLLFAMAGITVEGNGKLGEQAMNLTVGDLDGTYATADFYFVGQDKPVTYNVKFEFKAQERLNEKFEIYTTGLMATEKNDGYFDSIVYDATTGTATFTVSQDKKSSKFVDYKGMTDILGMFDQAVAGATKISFTVNGTTKTYPEEGSGEEPVVFNGKSIAKDLLLAMAKAKNNSESETKNAADLTLDDVVGVDATATIIYKVGKGKEQTINLKLKFVLATEAV